jgi:phosphoribosylglycinamide formyltransferase-1
MSLRVGVLGSTRGTALKGVLDAIAAGTLDVDLRIVISDKPTAPILDRAKLYKVPALFLDPTGLTREQYDERITAELHKARVDLVLLIGYMRILSPHFVAEWHGRLLNVHPSLLPAFAGLMNRKVHEAVLSSGVPETGCTIHQVTEEVDGGPIVLQKRCPVLPGDTVDSLKGRVQALEQSAFIDVLRQWNHLRDNRSTQ